MNATKRKFNALLGGIGNNSSSSLTSKEVNNASNVNSTAGSADSQNKKPRISSSISRSSLAPVLKGTPLHNKLSNMSHKKSASVATGVLSEETPKYAPWDRAAFLKRLKSFSDLTDWTPKPARVNEVQWAKRGWVCQKKERVRCCLCNVEIVVKLNRKEVDGKEEPVYVAQNIEDALVEKYVELIITSHDENCLWRKRGCDDSIFKLHLVHTQTTIQSLRERYDELVTRADTLPYEFNIKVPEGFDLTTVLSYLPRDFFTDAPSAEQNEEPSTGEINKVAFQMALFGWQGHVHDRLGVQLGSVSCQACFRVLGLWLFKSKKVNEAVEEVEGPIVNCLNVLKEHREYCPWQNAISQNGLKTASKMVTTPLAGWEIVLRVLKNDYQFRHGDLPTENNAKRSSFGDQATKTNTFFGTDADEEDIIEREEKDKERWARLRRVKSLFNTNSGKKLHKTTANEARNNTRT